MERITTHSRQSQGVTTCRFAILLLFSIGHVLALPIETVSRKRLGKSSFIHKQKHSIADGKDAIASQDEINSLASKSLLRLRGSVGYRKAWRHWSRLTVEAIRSELAENLPFPVNQERFERLAFGLGVAADMGEMPSFADAGARSGYALDFFCRARLLADIFVDDTNPSLPYFWKDSVVSELSFLGGDIATGAACNITSLGGGPGFDFVAAALVSAFQTGGKRGLYINAAILDYEEGWGDLVYAMECATAKVLQQPDFSCKWAGRCDITKSIYDPVNAGCLDKVSSTNIWTCQYCVAENALELRGSDFIFFRELFEAAAVGSLFILTETTPRVWPNFYELVNEHCKYMELGFPNIGGAQMVLRKSNQKVATKPSDKDLELLAQYEKYSERHERRISTGWIRQSPKIRGDRIEARVRTMS